MRRGGGPGPDYFGFSAPKGTALRILHVSEVTWGGVVGLVHEFTTRQVMDGSEVFLLAPDSFPDVPHVQRESWAFRRNRPSTYLPAYRQLRRATEVLRPDVVHLHSFLAGFIGRLPGAVRSTPVIYQPHAWSFDLREQRLFRLSLQLWERWAGRHTAFMVTNCQEEIDEGRAVGVTTDGMSIGVAIDVNRFSPVDDVARTGARHEVGVRRSHMVVCVGRLVRQKGQDLLVEAWERRRPADTELVLVGPGDATRLQALAPSQWGVTIRAVGEQGDVRPWLSASDALVLPSRYETVALVVAEAMACGRPVVATAVNGTTEVVTGGAAPPAGYIVPVGDMDALLTAVERVLAAPSTAAAMASAGRDRALDLFSARAVTDRLYRAYAGAIVGSGRPLPGSPSSAPAADQLPAPSRLHSQAK